ncbi:MAG: cysteine hydrolase [Acidobacteriota bacterium]|nr:cysteine hydrolase [Acidobacteriota bacterium]
MPAQLSINPTRSAVMSMDYMTGIVSIYAKDNQEKLTSRAASVLKEARSLGMPVIHVQVAFRPGLPEVSERNQLFGAIKTSEQHQQLFKGAYGAIHAAVAPLEDEVVITKHRVSAFEGTDLEMILRAGDIDTLIMFGIATSGVVLYSLLHAADRDYRLIVIKDCCVDTDREVHDCLVEKIFSRQAAIVAAREFIESLKSIRVSTAE